MSPTKKIIVTINTPFRKTLEINSHQSPREVVFSSLQTRAVVLLDWFKVLIVTARLSACFGFLFREILYSVCYIKILRGKGKHDLPYRGVNPMAYYIERYLTERR